jgi:uncharacterized protein YutE (UPF0331/DUF86 family)
LTDDVVLGKAQVIGRCLARVAEEYASDPENLEDIRRQDSVVLNVQRACEAAIDLAMHVVSDRRWGLPANSRDAFDLMAAHGVVDRALATDLKAMVGFRNLCVHNYQDIDVTLLRDVLDVHLSDLRTFAQAVFQYP